MTDRITLRRDVRIVQRACHTILIRTRGFSAVRVGAAANVVLMRLRDGAERSELLRLVQTALPEAGQAAEQLDEFLSRLESAGFLTSADGDGDGRDRWRRWDLLDINPLAESLSHAFVGMGAAAANVSACAFTLLAFAGLATALPHALSVGIRGAAGAWGAAFVLVFVVPLHELAHAVACRAAGVPVSGTGVLLHGGIIPGPFVDTSMIYTVDDRWARWRVPIAGPLVELWAAGAAAWLTLAVHAAPIQGASSAVILLSLALFLLDMNPFLPTDGSRAIEALLDDELARRAALGRRRATLSSPLSIWIYRSACGLYACTITPLGIMAWIAILR